MPYNVGYKQEDAYTRHRRWIQEYETYYSNGKVPPPPKTKTDLDVLRQHHQFLRDNDDDHDAKEQTWEDQLSLKWYNKLFREFAVIDLKHYKSADKIKLRWRTEDEVLERVGELTCGSLRCKYHFPREPKKKRGSSSRDENKRLRSRSPSPPPPPLQDRSEKSDGRRRRPESGREGKREREREEDESKKDEDEEEPLVPVSLTTFQLDFAYVEQGEDKQALVKCVLCPRCARKLDKSYEYPENNNE